MRESVNAEDADKGDLAVPLGGTEEADRSLSHSSPPSRTATFRSLRTSPY